MSSDAEKAKETTPSGGTGQRTASRAVESQQEYYIGLVVRLSIIGIAIFFALFPVLFIFSSAINPGGQLSTQSLVPSGVESLDDLTSNFRALMIDELDTFPFWNWIANSLMVAITTTLLVVMISALAAYSFSRFRFAGRRALLLFILLIQAFPNLLAMVAIFLILNDISRLVDVIPAALPFLDFIDWSFIELFAFNSIGGLIMVYLGGAMGVNTWLMKGFFDSVPKDIDESAVVDGATHWQTFWMLIFPLVRPILIVVGILTFVGTFNEFVLARIVLRDRDQWTLMIGLFEFINADFNRDWGKFAAGALLSAIPTVVIYISLQDQIVGGLTVGAVKG